MRNRRSPFNPSRRKDERRSSMGRTPWRRKLGFALLEERSLLAGDIQGTIFHYAPALAMEPDGDFIVVAPGAENPYGQRFDVDGVSVTAIDHSDHDDDLMFESLAAGERHASADEHDMALLSVMAEFEQSSKRSKRRSAINFS